MRHLVVAQFAENLDWVGKVRGPWTISIVRNGLHRDNTGREAGAYLWWLERWLDRLDNTDVVVFSQGDPFAHCQDFLNRIEQVPDDVDYEPLIDRELENLGCDRKGGPDHRGLPVGEWWERLMGCQFPTDFTFNRAAMFAVSVERLRAVDWGAVAACVDSPFGPWVIERLWQHLFGWQP